MKIREDVQTVPIEVNLQSAGVSQKEQIFYTNDDDETEEQYSARKEAIRKNPAIEELAVTKQTLSTNFPQLSSNPKMQRTKMHAQGRNPDRAILRRKKGKIPSDSTPAALASRIASVPSRNSSYAPRHLQNVAGD